MQKSVLVLVELTEDCAKLQVALAEVAQFEQLGGDVEFASGVIVVRRVLSGLAHLVDEALVLVKVGHLALQVENCPVQVACAVF